MESVTGTRDAKNLEASMCSAVLLGTTVSHVFGVSFGPDTCLSPHICSSLTYVTTEPSPCSEKSLLTLQKDCACLPVSVLRRTHHPSNRSDVPPCVRPGLPERVRDKDPGSGRLYERDPSWG